MNALAARTITALLVGLLFFSATGCSKTPAAKPTPKAPASVEASAPSPGEAASATVEASATTGTTTSSGTAAAPKKSKPAPSVTLGPTGAPVSWAYLKDMYLKNGVWYVVVDYIQVVGPEETLHFVNDNPRLRTFPLSNSAKLLLLTGSGGPDYKSVSVAQFKVFEGKSGDEVVEVTPKSGYATQLKEWWAP